MSNQLSYQLFDLIQSMTKSEKRHFKLYAKRNLGEKNLKFIQLFDVLDKMKSYDENKIIAKFQVMKPSMMSNLKSHLYEQLLISLRLLGHNEVKMRADELVAFAQVLYKKGLYSQSLANLNKANQVAQYNEDIALLLRIVEFKKLIESIHVTRSYKERAEDLIDEAKVLRTTLNQNGEWSDLSLKLYDYYLKYGHTKNKDEYDRIKQFFNEQLPDKSDQLSFLGRVSKWQCYVWYYYIVQEFKSCYKYSLRWVEEFNKEPRFKDIEFDLYVKGMHNCLSALFYCNESNRFGKLLGEMECFIGSKSRNNGTTSNSKACVYLETARLNNFFLKGEFTEGVKMVSEIEERIAQYSRHIDMHRMLIFWYKIACLYFGSGDNKSAIHYLNKIINNNAHGLREDVQCFARILNLVAHYELGNDDVIDYQVRSTYRYLLKMEDLQQVQAVVLNFLKKSVYMNRKDLRTDFLILKRELEEVLNDKYEWRPLLYLDLQSWLESKIEGRRVEEVVKEKQLAKIGQKEKPLLGK